MADKLSALSPVVNEIQTKTRLQKYLEAETGNFSILGHEADLVSTKTITIFRSSIVENKTVLTISNAHFVEEIETFREKVRGRNDLDPDFKIELLGFLDTTIRLIRQLQLLVGSPSEEITPEVSKGWLEQFQELAGEELGKYISPENASKAVVPLGVIACFSVTGALLGLPFGTPHVGAGVGGYVGNLVANQIKPGQAADKIKDAFDDDSGDSP